MVPVRRHARHWRTYLACGGLGVALTISAALAEQDSSSKSQTATAKPAVPNQSPATTVEPSPVSYVYPYDCQHPKSAEQDNLCVERDGVRAAEQQADWAQRTFWVALFGTVFVLITLYFTRRATDLAERTLRDLERPHVFVNIKPKIAVEFDEVEHAYVEFSVSNYGRFPAEITEFYAGLNSKTGIGTIRDRFHQVLGPDETLENQRIPFTFLNNVRFRTDNCGDLIGASPSLEKGDDTYFRIDVNYRGLGRDNLTTMAIWRWDHQVDCWTVFKRFRT